MIEKNDDRSPSSPQLTDPITHDDFYRAFEERFRGSRKLIKSRLSVYLPFLGPLKSICHAPEALDIGCGRGEWLELLSEHGFRARGVDLDEGMLTACYDNQLMATKEDGVAFLETLPNESQALVSGFHIAEHLPFSRLRTLVQQSFRVLKPGGLLILETPNPENLRVSSLTFFLDPTHHHPLPPQLLTFLVDYYGFNRTMVMRLQEAQVSATDPPSLDQVLGGASPDYAVVAQKASDGAIAPLFDDVFNREFGVDSQRLVEHFDRLLIGQRMRLAELAVRVDQHAAAQAVQVAELAARLDQERTAQSAQIAGLAARLDQENAARAALEASVRETLALLHASNTWHLTALLRNGAHAGQWIARGSWAWMTLKPNSRPRRVLARCVVGTARFCGTHPLLKALARNTLRTLPAGIQARIRSAIHRATPAIRQTLGPNATTSRFVPKYLDDRSLGNRYSGKKVALLTPVSPLGLTGGAERFYSGLTNSLRAHGCDLTVMQVPVDESSFEAIQDSYRYFESLDLSEFDCVVSTKAPSYAVFHENHVVYLVHTVRAFYDMFEHQDDRKATQRDWILRVDTQSIARARACFTIGHEVSGRLSGSNGIKASVLHPPLSIDGLYFESFGDYFFMPGRLHGWKRVDLAIQAIKASRVPLKLLISGEGEAEKSLRKLAAGDERIVFLGRLSDIDLYHHYANCLAVPFLPIREDYGYITLEAFAAGKPVVTCTDSGEPARIVQHNQTGLVVEPTVASLSQVFEALWRDRNLAKRLGDNARAFNNTMNWNGVTSQILNAALPVRRTSSESAPLRVVVLDMQPITPPIGGGRVRLLGLYHDLGADFQTRYIGSYDWPSEPYREYQLSETLVEITVPLSNEHHAAAEQAAAQSGGRTVIDMLFGRQGGLSPDYLAKVDEGVQWADIVVFSHPWVAPLLSRDMFVGKTIVYDAQNCEGRLRAQLLDAKDRFQADVIKYVIETERYVGDVSDLILACSEEDKVSFSEDYSWSDEKVKVVPNGVFCREIPPLSVSERSRHRHQLGIGDETVVAFFLGSDYGPNLEAATYIVDTLAPALPSVQFVVAGGCSAHLSERSPNCRLLGYLPDDDKIKWLIACDMALNPMFSGSGTNVKMFEYMGYSLPIIATGTGARGISETTSAGVVVCATETFADQVLKLSNKPTEERIRWGQRNREWAEAAFDWSKISAELGAMLGAQHARRRDANVKARTERIAHLSTTGLVCGIGEYTRRLIRELNSQGVANLLLSASNSDGEEIALADVPQPAVPVWKQDTREWRYGEISPEALRVAVEWGAQRLIIQYHPGFYAASDVADLARRATQEGMSICLVIHNFLDKDAPLMRYLRRLGCDLFCHRQTEVAEGQLHGVELKLMPLPVDTLDPGTRAPYGNSPRIGAFGFCRKHKGFRHLIAAMPLIAQRFPEATLTLMACEYPSSDSREELTYCHELIRQLQVTDIVKLDSAFRAIDEIHRELISCDLAVLPYLSSDEGGSAAAADCLAAGLPLVVSEAEIFDGIREYCFTTIPSPEAIAQAVVTVLSDADTYARLAAATDKYRRQYTWSAVARLLTE